MILLVGSSRDDTLYYETVLKNKVSISPLFGTFPMVKGTVFNQEVLIVRDVITSYASTLVVQELISKYQPLLIVLLGRCKGLFGDIKNGDVAISSSFAALDVDQCEFNNVKVAQIPGFQKSYEVSQQLLEILHNSFDKFTLNNIKEAAFYNSNKIYQNSDEIEVFKTSDVFLGSRGNAVLDSESFGTLLPCLINDVAFISIKVVDSKIGEKSTINHLVKTLEVYSLIGKAVVSFIGEIGRRDLME